MPYLLLTVAPGSVGPLVYFVVRELPVGVPAEASVVPA
jgi:hypothetical protein